MHFVTPRCLQSEFQYLNIRTIQTNATQKQTKQETRTRTTDRMQTQNRAMPILEM